jgi:hypothetical protein
MKRVAVTLLAIAMVGCAGWSRGCASWNAENFGADWIVIQQRMTDGEAFNCWILRNTSISSESGSDGIYWKDAATGHLVHIAGQYARVQVTDGRFKDAAVLVGVDADKCQGGRYPSKEAAAKE